MHWWGWVLVFLFLFGGIEYAQAILGAIVYRLTGDARTRPGLSKRKVRQLQDDHIEALDILREIDAYDRFAASPLPSGVHDRLRGFLDSKAGRAPLPAREENE